MFSKRMVLVILIIVSLLASCSPVAPAVPTAAPLPKPTQVIPTDTVPIIPTQLPPTITSTPAPKTFPKYWNSFEEVTDPAASMITSENSTVTINTDNVAYGGGKQALEISGTLAGEADAALSVAFSVKQLIGENNLDFSDKMIGFSVFIPKNSPLGYPTLTLRKGDKYVTIKMPVPVSENPYKFELRQGAWVDYIANVPFTYYYPGANTLTNGTEADIMNIIHHVESFSIGSSRSSSGTAEEAKFYVDDLNWIKSDLSKLPVDDSIDSLRKAATGKHFDFGLLTDNSTIFGAGINNFVWQGDPWYAYTAVQEGAVNTMSRYFSPKQGEDYSNFDYDRPEDAKIVQQFKFGEPYHMAVMGYSIGAMYARGSQFYWATPQWIQALAFPDAIQALLLYHIEKDVRYTKGKNAVWLLFNESILDNFDGLGARLRNRQQAGSDYSPWVANKADTSLIEAAFIKAREVDPGATLMLNDEPDADIGAEKTEYEYALVSKLKNDGVPIDGVGFELHNFIDPSGKLALWRTQSQYVYQNNTFVDMDTFLNNVDLNVKRYASIGMKVAFTEVEGQIKIGDIDLATTAGKAEYDKRLQWQAKYYAGLLKIALDNENVIMFHSWGITDRYQGATVWPGFGNGFIFDKNYHPKPAYYAMLDLLKSH